MSLRSISLAAAAALAVAGPAPAGAEGWKAGVAKVAITPAESTWMAGYAARTAPSDGALHDLWAKALAVEDPAGTRAVLVTLDICGIGRDLSVPIRDAIQSRLGLDRARVVLACSHTHSGPVVGTNLIRMYKLDDAQKARIREYSQALASKVVDVAAEAVAALAPAGLAWEAGRCDFAVNRRNNDQGKADELRGKLALKGPVDHDVPVLRVSDPAGKLVGVVFGYACHCTVLDGQQLSGDYAGFAQDAVEAAHPGATALFFAGCGADQNPLPRRSVELARRYGNQLAESVSLVLARPMRPVDGTLGAAYREIDLPFASLPTREQVEAAAEGDNFYEAGRARALLEQFEADGKLAPTYPYPVQAWRLGDLDWVFLGGEVVVDFALRIKGNLGGSDTWVAAYCNDVMAYIPSLRVLKEGGYEGGGAMVYYALPSPWAESVEEDIIDAVNATLREASPSPSAPSPAP